MSEGSPPLKVVVAGGSVGGLCAAVALRAIGCEVGVYERATSAMTARGAGIVVQGDLVRLLRLGGAPELPATSCLQRLYLLPGGGDGVAVPMPQRFPSWDAIFRTLRVAFPDESYHSGSALTGFEVGAGRVVASFAKRGEEVEADLLVCADGSRSEARRRLLPGMEPAYAGYVAWRGTLEEAGADAGLVRFFDDSFAFCEARSGGHVLCYFIPGLGAAIEPGRRRLNWVWYVVVPEGPKLARLLTDRFGKAHAGSVPAGLVPEGLVTELHEAAGRELHPPFAELVRATRDPFVQVIVDAAVPRMAFGRACLLGDAAFVVRPHVAAATAKAAADATTLAEALAASPGDPERALSIWQAQRLEGGRGLVEHGIALGRRTVRPPGSTSHPLAATVREAAELFGAVAQPPHRA